MPDSFIPNMDAKNDSSEWERYNFSPSEMVELGEGIAPYLTGSFGEHGGTPPPPKAHQPDTFTPIYPLGQNDDFPPPLEEMDEKFDFSPETEIETGPLQPPQPIPAGSTPVAEATPAMPRVSETDSQSLSQTKTSDRTMRERKPLPPPLSQHYRMVAPMSAVPGKPQQKEGGPKEAC